MPLHVSKNISLDQYQVIHNGATQTWAPKLEVITHYGTAIFVRALANDNELGFRVCGVIPHAADISLGIKHLFKELKKENVGLLKRRGLEVWVVAHSGHVLDSMVEVQKAVQKHCKMAYLKAFYYSDGKQSSSTKHSIALECFGEGLDVQLEQ